MPTKTHPDHTARTTICALTAIACTYLYFLIYAEFALIELVRQTIGGTDLRLVLGALALGGISGSLTCAVTHKPSRARLWFTLGQLLCTFGAAASLFSRGLFSFSLTSLLVGIGLGWSTVALSLCLRPSLHLPKLGWWCGIGTGLAYFIANQPWLFHATPRHQTLSACAVAIIGVIASLGLRGEPSKPSGSPDYSWRGWIIWALLFIALVWLDSAAFYIIQHTDQIRAGTWESIFALEGNALLHLLVAILAGYLLDRRIPSVVTTAAFILLIAACLTISLHSRYLPLTRVLYVIAVSLYSTALIYVPARSGRPLYIAGLFALAGWIGSALGIGMAQDLNRIPHWFLLTAGLIFTTAMFMRNRLKTKT